MEQIVKELEKYGYKAGFVAVESLTIIKQDIQELYSTGKINESLYGRYLSGFNFELPLEMQDAASIITVAVPKPLVIAEFGYKNRIIPAAIPNIYPNYEKTYSDIAEILFSISPVKGYKFFKTSLPEKLLASKSGMVFYGKNNIGYIPGLGSFFQLVSFFTNIKCSNDGYQEQKMLERCSTCTACVKLCPTHAITEKRFLINADKCLTFFNENPGIFPDWINSGFHNSLIGCMICQKVCPENKKAVNRIEISAYFDDEETYRILKANQIKELPELIIKKIEALELNEPNFGFDEFRRNLKALIERE